MTPNSASPLGGSPGALLVRRTRMFTSHGIHVDGSWNGEALQTLEEAAFLYCTSHLVFSFHKSNHGR